MDKKGFWALLASVSGSWRTLFTRNKDSFRFRQAAGSNNDDLPESNGRAVINTIYGNTIKWNQLMQNGNFSDGLTKWTYYGSTELEFIQGRGVKIIKQGSSTGAILRQRQAEGFSVANNHVYYFGIDCLESSVPEGTTVVYGMSTDVTLSTTMSIALPITSTGRFSKIRKTNESSNYAAIGVRCGYSTMPNGSYVIVDNLQLIDLTDIFGTDAQIAAALGIQEADITTDTGVAAFEQWLALNVGKQDYYPHDEGSLISFKGTGIKTYIDGWNQLASVPDESWTGYKGTVDIDNDVATLTADGTGRPFLSYPSTPIVGLRTYYISAFFKPSITVSCSIAVRDGSETNYLQQKDINANTIDKLRGVYKPSNNTIDIRYFLRSSTLPSGTTLQVWNDQIIDLTEIFGTDAQIAAALGIEEADITTNVGVAAFEEWLQVHIGRQDYYEYTQPSKFPIDEKPFDVTKVYGKLNGAGNYVQVFTNKDSGDQSISYYGMNFVDHSYYTKEDKIYIDSDTGKLTAIQATKKADLGNATWVLYTGQSHTFRTSTYGTSGTDNNPVNIVGYNTQGTNALTDSSGDLLANFSSGGTRGLRIVNQSLSSSDIVNGKIAALEGVEMVYGLIPPKIYTELIYRDNGTDTPLEEIFPIKYKVDKYSSEELLVPASVAGEPTSTAIIADIDYQKKG